MYTPLQENDSGAVTNVEDSGDQPTSPSAIAGVNKTTGSNYGSVPKERRARFPGGSISSGK